MAEKETISMNSTIQAPGLDLDTVQEQEGQRVWVLVRPASGVVKVTRDFRDVTALGI